MKTSSTMLVLALALVPALAPAARGISTPTVQVGAVEVVGKLPGRDWILQSSDNVCGLRDARQLTHPAVIDYQACLDATPEMKKVRDRGIDLASAKGIQLKNAALTRVTNACDAVRKANGHCSVWKAIRHKDGRAIPDVSSLVQAKF